MIHPTAIISGEVTLGNNVSVGAYTTISGNVKIGDNCVIGARVSILGNTTIGEGTEIHAGAIIGDFPQDISFDGSIDTFLIIGKNCKIREYVTINCGSPKGITTQIGDNCMLMAFTHVGHDCILGNHINIANNTLLAGHIEIGDKVNISASVLVHQFVKIGPLAMIGGGAHVKRDVPPYCSLSDTNVVAGINSIGLKRSGINNAARTALKDALQMFYLEPAAKQEILDKIENTYSDIPEVLCFLTAIKESKRGFMPYFKTKSD